MLLLTETAAGYALLKAKDSKVKNVDQLLKEDGITSLFKVKAFSKFDSAASALDEVNSIIEGKVSSKLSQLLSELKEDSKGNLLVADPKLGNAINKLPGLSFNVTSDSKTAELFRAVREHLPELLPGLSDRDLTTMSLGLAHSLGRYKLKFSPDKVDTMIVHAIGLLDDLDKELNTYSMRLKEWYGWHFPEMAKIVSDNVAYARVVKALGYRTDAATTDLAEILPEDIEQQLRTTAEISMGTEITASDLEHINSLADQIIELAAYREQLYSYLTSRMSAIAPNLTVLVGELVGARLIAHSGSMTGLAKAPASTIQILGAEKALFRALKTKKDTPKYGLIYNASLVGQASGRNKGKIARMLAAKCSLGLRYDAFTEDRDDSPSVGLEGRTKVETRLGLLEGRDIAITRPVVGARNQQKVEVNAAPAYNESADAVMIETVSSPAAKLEDGISKEERKRLKKEKKAAEKASKKDSKRKREPDSDDESEVEVDVSTTIESSPLKQNGEAKKKRDKKDKKEKHKDKKDKKKKKTSE